MERVLGLDFGGVISLAKTTDDLMPGVEEGIDAVREIFGDRIYIISRVDSAESQARVLAYMENRKLWDRLGISQDNIRFCLLKSDKGPIAKDLHITDFVDDHTEVLANMHTVENRYAMRTKPEELELYPAHNMELCQTWEEISNAILNLRWR